MKTLKTFIISILILFYSTFAVAKDASDVIAKAPVLLIMLDNSGSSPATQSQVVNSA